MEYLRNIISSKKKRIKNLYGTGDKEKHKTYEQAGPDTKKKSGTIKKLSENIDEGRVNIIAEIKKASPSKGLINEFSDIRGISLLYDKHSDFIRGISVVTEETYFMGSITFIEEVKKTTGIPVLRKDFIFHELQVHESAANGADCILLISSILGYRKLKQLYNLTLELGMESVVEVHSISDLVRTLDIDAKIIGINNRDLRSMQVDRENVFRIHDFAQKSGVREKIFISESGIGGSDMDSEIEYIKRLFDRGINTILIGTYLMESTDLALTLEELGSIFSANGLV